MVVTEFNDSEDCLKWVVEKHLKEAGAETPLHFTRYYHAYKFNNPPTNIEILERVYEMAQEAGVTYPYLWNVWGHRYENTYCPDCGEKLIQRFGYTIISYKVTSNKKCPKCNQLIPITGNYIRK